MTKSHYMKVGETLPAEQWERPGKPEWPDFVTFELSEHQAWELVNSMLYQLRSRRTESEIPITYTVPGKLEPLEDS